MALLACGGAYWPLALEPSAMTSRPPHYCGHLHRRGHPPAPGGESRMQLLPMASSPDGLISVRYAVITKTPGWEVLTTTSNWGGGGGTIHSNHVFLCCFRRGRRPTVFPCITSNHAPTESRGKKTHSVALHPTKHDSTGAVTHGGWGLAECCCSAERGGGGRGAGEAPSPYKGAPLAIDHPPLDPFHEYPWLQHHCTGTRVRHMTWPPVISGAGQQGLGDASGGFMLRHN